MHPLRVLCAALCLVAAVPALAAEYQLGPESTNRAPGVLKGRVEKFTFTESKVFPDTTRDCWIYIPAQYDGTKPAALMVFQDGGGYASETSGQRVPIVFDNLIAKGEMPVTIGVFINPGNRTAPDASAPGANNRSNRSFEYDSLGDAYARFLIDEFLPFVVKKFDVKLTDDPELRAICGASSGAICAFTVAWERPFSRSMVSYSAITTELATIIISRFNSPVHLTTSPERARLFPLPETTTFGSSWMIGSRLIWGAPTRPQARA